MAHSLTIVMGDLRRAVVREDADGMPVIRYERRGVPSGAWRLDHEARPKLPFHAALDLAHDMLHREVGK